MQRLKARLCLVELGLRALQATQKPELAAASGERSGEEEGRNGRERGKEVGGGRGAGGKQGGTFSSVI